MAAVPDPLHPPAVAAAPIALVARGTANVDAAEPQALDRPQLPTQDVRNSDSSVDSLSDDNFQNFRKVSEAPLGLGPVEQKLPAEAIPTNRQPSRQFFRRIYNWLTIAKLALSGRELFVNLVDIS